jgi:hypothetical protein
MLKFITFMVCMGFVSPAFAIDWKQQVTDQSNEYVTDWMKCPGKDPAKGDKCGEILTYGEMIARALLMADTGMTPEQKALAGHLAIKILTEDGLVPTPDQLKMARDAAGRLPSPLAVARAWDFLDSAIK